MHGKPFQKTPAVMALLWLMACLVPSTTLAASEQRIAELMKVSGLEQQVQSAAGAFSRGIRNAAGDNPQVPEESIERLEGISEDVFSADSLVSDIRDSLTSELSDSELDRLLEWYRSETGRRITQAEVATSEPGTRTEMMQKGAKLVEQRPELAGKARAINDLVKGTDFLVDLNRHTAQAIMHAVRSQMDSEAQRRQFTQSFEKQLDRINQQFRQNAEQMMVRSATYSYRNIGPDRMDAYLEFLKTPAARKFTRLSMDSLGDALKKRIDEFAGELAGSV